MQHEMTDTEIRDEIRRADRFRDELRTAINETVVDSGSNCADASRRGLKRIADTFDAVPFVMFANLSNIDAAMRTRGAGLVSIIEVYLRAVGSGPTLDYADATVFLTQFEPLVTMARKRRIN